MKRFISLVLIIGYIQLSGQIADDALIISRYNYTGTARTQAMGGAFTALGGDITSASLNPAGLGLYRSNDFSFSLMGNMNNSESTFYGSKSTSSHLRITLPNIGIALSAPNLNKMSNGDGPESWTFAIGYNQIHSFNKNIMIEGINNQSSYLDMVLDNPSYYPTFTETDLIFDDGGLTHDYLESGYGALQTIFMSERGGIGEYFISGAANFQNKLFIGGTVGIQNFYLERIFEVSETPTNDISLNYFDMSQSLVTKGLGINAKIGILYAPVYWSKIGISLHTPTSFNLTDSQEESLDANITYVEGTFINSYTESPYYPDYNILTPMRVNTGVSFLILKQALLAIDYEYADYGTAQISSSDYNFTQENNEITEVFKAAHSFRIGGEYKLGVLALRAGGFFYGSPYEKETINKDNHILGYSAGIGLKSGSTYFDISFSKYSEELKVSPYTYETVDIKNKNTRISATLGFRF